MSRREQFFHGGAAHLEPGDLVLPAMVHGQRQVTGNGGAYAWATTDPGEAASFARSAARDGSTGRVYKVRPIDGDTRQPDDARRKAQGRETGWLVESPVWDTTRTDAERQTRIATGNARMTGYREQRRKRTRAYERDSRLNPQEREVKNATLSEVSPEHRDHMESTRRLLDLLKPSF